MIGLRFEEQAAVVESAPTRTDIACFVGFVGRRNGQLPDEASRWLIERSWNNPAYGRAPLIDLLDLPVPIDTWDVFDRLFAWDHRDFDGHGRIGTTYLGAAVRSFFAQGGRKCYVVRLGDPLPFPGTADSRLDAITKQLEKLLPGYPGTLLASPVDQASWRGVGHVLGLLDVSCLCLPDLSEIVAAESLPIPPLGPRILPEADFEICSEPEPVAPADTEVRRLHAPRCDETGEKPDDAGIRKRTGYTAWATVLNRIAHLLSQYRRDVQLIAAIPIPIEGLEIERHLLKALVDSRNGPLAADLDMRNNGVATAFIQLVYPWVRTRGSSSLPEQLESPEGVLAGMLARNALSRGAFRSAAGSTLNDVYDLYPVLPREQMDTPEETDITGRGSDKHVLAERVSLFSFTPGGLRLLSDVTTSLDESYRPANINRLVSLLVRATRQMGEEVVFESSGEALWVHLKDRLDGLLSALWQAGALRGATSTEAFHVRCDRSTMTQSDLDSGRVVVEVKFQAAAPVEAITVILAMDEGGQVSLLSETGAV